MDVISGLNLCKLFFASVTLSMILIGLLLNICEPYLPVLITKTFRYGKFASTADSVLVQKLELPKSYFRHFYLASALLYAPITVYEITSVYLLHGEVSAWFKHLLNFSCGYEGTTTVSSLHVFIAIILLTLQIFRRFYDTHFVSVFSKKASINLSHYVIGMIYYPAVFLVILSEAPKFANSEMTVFKDVDLHFYDVGVLEVLSITLFLWAWYHQHIATKILGNIRKNTNGTTISQSYKIPEGDWFEYLSSPHCTAEIIMYTSLTLLLSNHRGWWYVYIWVLSNQVETTLLSHWWYQSRFEKQFPKKRKALIPFIY